MKSNDELVVPEGVSVSVEPPFVSVSCKSSSLRRRLFDPVVSIRVADGKVLFSAAKGSRNEKRKIGTFRAHIRNMFCGVTQGHFYRLKVCASHFPVTVSVQGAIFSVKNFLGEKVPRTMKLRPGVDVKVNGDIIEVRSIDKEAASQTAADIENLTRRANVDLRVFQDGCYIIEKDGVMIK